MQPVYVGLKSVKDTCLSKLSIVQYVGVLQYTTDNTVH